MKRRLWVNKWFILACVFILFLMATGGKVMAAGTDNQLQMILTSAIQGLQSFFNFLLDTLKTVW